MSIVFKVLDRTHRTACMTEECVYLLYIEQVLEKRYFHMTFLKLNRIYICML